MTNKPLVSDQNDYFSVKLTKEQAKVIGILLNLIIPESKDGKMPSATDINFINYIHKNNQASWINEGLFDIISESQKNYGEDFSKLTDSEQIQLIDNLRKKYRKYFNRLTAQVIQCYYQNDEVLKAIGLELRPPFPKGQYLDEGDLTLLEPVYLRGKIYRE